MRCHTAPSWTHTALSVLLMKMLPEIAGGRGVAPGAVGLSPEVEVVPTTVGATMGFQFGFAPVVPGPAFDGGIVPMAPKIWTTWLGGVPTMTLTRSLGL